MTTAREIAAFVDELLDAERFRATEPENRSLFDAESSVRRIGAAVNTSMRAIDAAGAAEVDLLLVHHASWQYIELRTHGPKMSRLRELGISLYCAHGPWSGSLSELTTRSRPPSVGRPRSTRTSRAASTSGSWPAPAA